MNRKSVLYLLVALLGGGRIPLQAQERPVALHTNSYYFGPVKEEFTAYTGDDGKLVKHGQYRDWAEDGSLWHDIEYRDDQPHGATVTFYPNGRKASETFYVDGKWHGLETVWNRNGEIVARGTNRHGANWDGTFVNERRYSVRSRWDEDIRFYVSEYRNGIRKTGEAREVFDDGSKWKPPPQPINYRRLLRWFRYSYEIDSSYPYLGQLPPWSEIPTLLEWVNSNRSDAGVEVAYSQLVALSRADFGHPQHPPGGGLPAETVSYYRSQRSDAWAEWWKSVGKPYGERLRTRGQQHPQAWKLVSRDNRYPLPEYKVAIPDEWVFTTSYRAGDYGSIQ